MRFCFALTVAGALLLDGLPVVADDALEPTDVTESDPVEPDEGSDEPSTTEVDTSHRTAARGGIITGTVLEGLGLAGVLAGSLTAAIADSGGDAGLAVMIAAGSAFTLGSFVSTVAHTSRHRAYEAAGISTRRNMPVFSWLFTAGTTALWAVAVSQYAGYLDAEDGWNGFGYGLGTLLSISASMICEILDLSVFRVLWRRDMNRAEEEKLLTFTVAPTSRGPGLAVIGAF